MPTELPVPPDQRERAIVLVHGAWVGDWSWSPILAGLGASGRTVHNVALTGQGSRRHQNGPHITLADHVADVVGVMDVHDLANVTLVGHSYGGRVISQVWAQASDRIKSMVYLDAHTPIAPDAGTTPERDAIAAANGGMLPFNGYDPDPEMVGGDAAVAWFMERTVMQSYATVTSPWQVKLPAELTKHFVFAASDEPSRFAGYAEVARSDATWIYHELPGTHFLMMTHPNEVTKIILDA